MKAGLESEPIAPVELGAFPGHLDARAQAGEDHGIGGEGGSQNKTRAQRGGDAQTEGRPNPRCHPRHPAAPSRHELRFGIGEPAWGHGSASRRSVRGALVAPRTSSLEPTPVPPNARMRRLLRRRFAPCPIRRDRVVRAPE